MEMAKLSEVAVCRLRFHRRTSDYENGVSVVGL
jgi:hypothetical protein